MSRASISAEAYMRGHKARLMQSGWGAEEFRSVRRSLRIATLGRGEQVATTAGSAGMLGLVAAGQVAVCGLLPSGRTVPLTHCRFPGDAFAVDGQLSGLLFQVPYALTDETCVLTVPWPDLEVASRSNPLVAVETTRLARAALSLVEHSSAEHAIYSTRARLAHKLCELAEPTGESVVALTHAQLGLLVGAPQEKVTKALHELRREGLVSFRNHAFKTIRVVDHDKLAAYAT